MLEWVMIVRGGVAEYGEFLHLAYHSHDQRISNFVSRLTQTKHRPLSRQVYEDHSPQLSRSLFADPMVSTHVHPVPFAARALQSTSLATLVAMPHLRNYVHPNSRICVVWYYRPSIFPSFVHDSDKNSSTIPTASRRVSISGFCDGRC